MKITAVLVGNIAAAFEEQLLDIRRSNTTAVQRAGEDLKSKLRAQVKAAGLGDKVANAWRNRSFGKAASYNPAALVWSKAPIIHAAFNEGTVIKTKNGERFIAIPSENVPRKAGGKRRTPMEMEDWLNGDLDFRPYRNGRPGGVLVARGVTRSNNGRSWRKLTARRRAKGRLEDSVVMFYLVPAARLRKRLDIEGAVRDVGESLVNRLRK